MDNTKGGDKAPLNLEIQMSGAKPSTPTEPGGSERRASEGFMTRGPQISKRSACKVSRLMSYFEHSSITSQASCRIQFVGWGRGTAGNTRWCGVRKLSKPVTLSFLPQLNYPEGKLLRAEPTLSMTVIIQSKRREGTDKSSNRDRVKEAWVSLYHFMATTEEGVVELSS